mmetsp:Transcript_6606/g.10812  ORF Transcript_6606/g.10812 Transcript_6606/m.10812 type:complete len:402 (-) Transcript_6606:374-1579(-)
MMLHNVLMGLLVCHFAVVVVCRQTLSPTILFKSTNAQHATVSKSRQLLRSITPNLVIRGGNSGDKKDTEDTGISWDSHMNVNNIPATLLNKLDGSHTMRAKFEKLCRESQESICAELEKIDGFGKFQVDSWVRKSGGGGISRVMQGGKVFEKAGVNLSVVYGKMPQSALLAATERGVDRAKGMKEGEMVPFFACGISSVIHPKNPHCPTMHFNYRYFETEGGVWWFGGGTDLTPSYVNVDDIRHFHQTYKDICDKHDPSFYEKFKKWADKYFMIAHRGETRGVGGIFFDDLNDRDPENLLSFASDALKGVVKSYVPIIAKHKQDSFTPEEKEWQQLRRGRYVEFNLVYDRGTTFGLKTGGRVESILMSLPETARWEYCQSPTPGSAEDTLVQVCKKPVDWV